MTARWCATYSDHCRRNNSSFPVVGPSPRSAHLDSLPRDAVERLLTVRGAVHCGELEAWPFDEGGTGRAALLIARQVQLLAASRRVRNRCHEKRSAPREPPVPDSLQNSAAICHTHRSTWHRLSGRRFWTPGWPRP